MITKLVWVAMVIACCVGMVTAQSRTSDRILSVALSQLTTAQPDGSERHVINASATAGGVCQAGTAQMYAIKLSGIWKCSAMDPSVGIGDIVGPASSTTNDIAAFGSTTGKLITDSGYTIAFLRSASNLNAGTLPDARFPGTLPAASGNNLTALNASNLSGGTVPDGRFPATLPAASGINLTAINAASLGSGTVPDARFPATLPAASGVNLTALNAANLTSGTVAKARQHAATVYTDQANTFGGFMQDFTIGRIRIPIYASAPTSPAAADGDEYLNSTDHFRYTYSFGAWRESLLNGLSSVNVGVSGNVTGTLPVANGGTGVATLTGIAKGNGTSAFTAVTAPSGAIVGDTDTQTLTNKTLTNPAITLQTLTDAATITWDANSGNMAQVTLAGNRTVAAPSNLKTGGSYSLTVIQDATGSRTLTWNSVFKWPGATAPTLTATASRTDLVTCISNDGTNLLCNALLDVR